MKVQKILIRPNAYSWIVLNNKMLPIKPICSFIKFCDNVDKSPNTSRSYAHSLKLYWEYLGQNDLNWKSINVSDLAKFVGWLRAYNLSNQILDITNNRSAKKNSSINAILACLSSFYRFHNHLGVTNIKLHEVINLPGNRYKSLLQHAFRNKPIQRRLISVKQPKMPPKTISEDQFKTLVNLCSNPRDQFLIWLLYETGLRIGQALTLRHDDFICWDNEIHVKYRHDNINEVSNKTIVPNIIPTSSALMNLYSEYISTLDHNKLNEYVFINLVTYEPIKYIAIRKLFLTLSQKCGFYIRPHMLRHTHATDLFNAGIEMALIQKRLGHSSIQTTINTYTHCNTKQMKAAFKKYLSYKGVQ